ncbi:HNH endonuclease [Mycolicibacterium lutetiense]|uniref:5-methylcytosine-specific restriction protein A n=1 Tax=Mycolicibacterium lutetiense TaxID=1641992 RepID=A0ABS4ZYM5_9MYCO|nr:HNH endonuclease [Mycolicibacterium lutetiense]MBP2454619.1 5-methylcytosine-specific restriction protein A [Mycolicibacterium lutetiense]
MANPPAPVVAKELVDEGDVLKAIVEFDELTRGPFLAKYGFGEAKDYFLIHKGKHYDSKAIFAAAHGFHEGLEPLNVDQLSGGKTDAAKWLKKLGFAVPTSEPDWTRDELILACDALRQNNWKGLGTSQQETVDLSALLQCLPIHPPNARGVRFRNPDGVSMKTYNIAAHLPGKGNKLSHGNRLDGVVLQDFLDNEAAMIQTAQLIRDGVGSGVLTADYVDLVDIDEMEGEAPEGRLLERRHMVRERSRSLRTKKIAQHLAQHGNLACETCGFDFRAAYGDKGDGIIECHHVVPLHESGPKSTRLKDLVLICANCHRMIHHARPWMNPDQLRALIAAAKANG